VGLVAGQLIMSRSRQIGILIAVAYPRDLDPRSGSKSALFGKLCTVWHAGMVSKANQSSLVGGSCCCLCCGVACGVLQSFLTPAGNCRVLKRNNIQEACGVHVGHYGW
jgi:cation transporter-like permease